MGRWRWYWFTLRRPLPVTFHLGSDRTVLWTGIYGVQVGATFWGIVRSREEGN